MPVRRGALPRSKARRSIATGCATATDCRRSAGAPAVAWLAVQGRPVPADRRAKAARLGRQRRGRALLLRELRHRAVTTSTTSAAGDRRHPVGHARRSGADSAGDADPVRRAARLDDRARRIARVRALSGPRGRMSAGSTTTGAPDGAAAGRLRRASSALHALHVLRARAPRRAPGSRRPRRRSSPAAPRAPAAISSPARTSEPVALLLVGGLDHLRGAAELAADADRRARQRAEIADRLVSPDPAGPRTRSPGRCSAAAPRGCDSARSSSIRAQTTISSPVDCGHGSSP